MRFETGDVARIIHGFDSGPLRIAGDRVRNYAKEGLIEPLKRHPGRGRSQEYSLDMVKRIIILDALQKAGMTATYAVEIMKRCPDLSQGRATIKLGPGVSITIDGRALCQVLEAASA